MALSSIKSITQNLSDMNKFLDDISEYKIVDRLKEKLQESENLKLEIEAILIKRVSHADDFMRNQFISSIYYFIQLRMLCSWN